MWEFTLTVFLEGCFYYKPREKRRNPLWLRVFACVREYVGLLYTNASLCVTLGPLTHRQLGLYTSILTHASEILPFPLWVVLFQWPGPPRYFSALPLIPHIILLVGHRSINRNEMFQRERVCVSVCVKVVGDVRSCMCLCVCQFLAIGQIYIYIYINIITGCWLFLPIGGDKFFTPSFKLNF